MKEPGTSKDIIVRVLYSIQLLLYYCTTMRTTKADGAQRPRMFSERHPLLQQSSREVVGLWGGARERKKTTPTKKALLCKYQVPGYRICQALFMAFEYLASASSCTKNNTHFQHLSRPCYTHTAPPATRPGFKQKRQLLQELLSLGSRLHCGGGDAAGCNFRDMHPVI